MAYSSAAPASTSTGVNGTIGAPGKPGGNGGSLLIFSSSYINFNSFHIFKAAMAVLVKM